MVKISPKLSLVPSSSNSTLIFSAKLFLLLTKSSRMPVLRNPKSTKLSWLVALLVFPKFNRFLRWQQQIYYYYYYYSFFNKLANMFFFFLKGIFQRQRAKPRYQPRWSCCLWCCSSRWHFEWRRRWWSEGSTSSWRHSSLDGHWNCRRCHYLTFW